MPRTGDPWYRPELRRHRLDAVGRRRGRFAAYRAGDLVERDCDLGRWRWARRSACYSHIGLSGLAGVGGSAGGYPLRAARAAVKAAKGKAMSFRAVLGRVWPYGMALALASAGFGVIATFITLFYDAKVGTARLSR